ncbi:MAG: MotA/TolQ/ExbB proton channel family protein [Candidatus Hydrogenedentes bacterium]|nr:MotA/TolQ/ExbB proton channel family protein [Candidatus Hydrogenedentota bacterium]
MDIATIIGIAAGIILVMSAILQGGNFGMFVNIPSIMIVVGGTLAATLINFPLQDVLGVIKTVKNAFLHKAVPPTKIIQTVVAFATTARRDGILALESQASEAGDEFLERSVQLAVDGTAPELIKDILTTELAFLEERHSLGQGVFTSMGTFAPAFGMIGTLIGLINMLATLEDPSTIGAGMAVALITTFYGAFMANLIFLPIAGKLKVRTRRELLTKEVIIEGILSIQSGDNPRVVEQKLKAFIAPTLREQVETGRK